MAWEPAAFWRLDAMGDQKAPEALGRDLEEEKRKNRVHRVDDLSDPGTRKSKHCFSNQQHVGKPCRKAASVRRDSATMFSHARGISYKGGRAPLDEP